MESTNNDPSIWTSLGAFVFSATVAIVAVELILRAFTVFPIHSASANKVPHPRLAYTINTELQGIDSSGFRNETVLHRADVAAIGDSHTFGYNVSSENAWPAQLADMSGLTVYNFGVGSYGMFIYYELLGRALDLSPQYIIVALYPSNDIVGMCNRLKMPYWQKRGRNLGIGENLIDRCARNKKETNSSVFEEAKKRFYHTALGSALDALIWDPIKGRLPADLLDVVEIETPEVRAFIPKKKLERDAHKMDLARPEIRKLHSLSLTLFRKMAIRAQKANAQLGVMLVPSKERALYPYARRSGSQLPEIYHTAVQRERQLVSKYKRFFEEHGIKFVDVTARLRTKIGAEGGRIYPLIDSGHPFADGYRAYARAACETLIEGCNAGRAPSNSTLEE